MEMTALFRTVFIFLLGLMAGSCFIMAVYYAFYRKETTNFHHFFVVLLCTLIAQILLGEVVNFGTHKATETDWACFLTVCLYDVPVAISFVESMYRPQLKLKQLYKRTMTLLPIHVLLTILLYITENYIFVYLSLAYVVLVVATCLVRLPKWRREYYRFVNNTYSSTENKDFGWMKRVVGYAFLWFVVYVLTVIIQSPWLYCLYMVFATLMVCVLNHYIFFQEIIEVKQVSDVQPVTVVKYAVNVPDNSQIEQQLHNIIEEGRAFLNPELSIYDISQQIGVEKKYLSNYLNNVQHTNFNEYINNLRLDYSYKMIRSNPKLDINEYWQMAGFNSYDIFRQLFLQRFNLTPRKYQNELLHMSPVELAKLDHGHEMRLFEEALEGKNAANVFYQLFEQLHPDFLQHLSETEVNLSGKEQLLCMLLFVEIDTARIAKTLKMTRESLRVTKSRLNGKLNPSKKYPSLDEMLKSLA